MEVARTMKIGFLINPIAGMGGRVGFKGADELAEEAIALCCEKTARNFGSFAAIAAAFILVKSVHTT